MDQPRFIARGYRESTRLTVWFVAGLYGLSAIAVLVGAAAIATIDVAINLKTSVHPLWSYAAITAIVGSMTAIVAAIAETAIALWRFRGADRRVHDAVRLVKEFEYQMLRLLPEGLNGSRMSVAARYDELARQLSPHLLERIDQCLEER